MKDKKELREQAIKRLKAMNKDDRKKIQDNLYLQLFSSDEWAKADAIGITVSQDLELDTAPIIEKGLSQGKIMVVPRTMPKRQMQFYKYIDQSHLEVSSFGVKEPKDESDLAVAKEDIDLILVPGLIYEANGYRVGFGGGYYDRFLADYQGQTVSLLFPEQYTTQASWEIDAFDIPVDRLLVGGQGNEAL